MKTVRRSGTGIFILFLTVGSIFAQTSAPQITVESIYRDYQATGTLPAHVRWLPQSARFSYVTPAREGNRALILEDAASGASDTLISAEKLTALAGGQPAPSLENYQWMPDEHGVIFTGDGEVWAYSLEDGSLTRLTETKSDEELVRISPDGRYVSYVREYNLYVRDLKSGRERQLTSDGNATLFNGKLDWVYQEELVGRGTFDGYWWSPDSKQIAYLQFDEQPVPEYPLVDWIPYHPDLEMMHYPKAGDPNPVVRLGVVPVGRKPRTVWMDLGQNTDIYIPRVFWVPGGAQLAFMRLDRSQQHLEFLLGDIKNGNSRVILSESDPYWINIEDDVTFLKDSPRFLWGSARDGYRHLYLYKNDGTLVRQLTTGKWMVTALNGVDEQRNEVYFTSTRQSVTERQLYRVSLEGGAPVRLSQKTGTHDAEFSSGRAYYIDTYSDLTTPDQLSLHAGSGRVIRSLGNSDQPFFQEYHLRTPELFTFRGDNGMTYHASLLKPPDFDPSKKYPVLIYVYGGPHVQIVTREFGGTRFLWHQMMARKGYIVFSMDNRGSYGRGHAWEQVIYHQMGKTELVDQLEGVGYLKSLPYVDPDRIGIWGWSYGGYMTLYSLTHAGVFRAGASVAPVADWRDYDTIYTERYMGLPQDNPEGYKTSSPVNAAEALSGRLLLVHGTSDDNVHLQNSIQMIQALIEAGQPFDLMLYPRQKHGIAATKDRIHLFDKLTRHFDTYLK